MSVNTWIPCSIHLLSCIEVSQDILSSICEADDVHYSWQHWQLLITTGPCKVLISVSCDCFVIYLFFLYIFECFTKDMRSVIPTLQLSCHCHEIVMFVMPITCTFHIWAWPVTHLSITWCLAIFTFPKLHLSVYLSENYQREISFKNIHILLTLFIVIIYTNKRKIIYSPWAGMHCSLRVRVLAEIPFNFSFTDIQQDIKWSLYVYD